jgi:hypothetical protein
VRNDKARVPAGYFPGPDGALALRSAPPPSDKDESGARYESRVTVVRKGGVRLPVELQVEFADGRVVRERWDGRERWYRFRYEGAKVVRAVIDPEHKIAIDVDPSNGEWLDDARPARRAAWKWAARYLLWLQNLLELHSVVG